MPVPVRELLLALAQADVLTHFFQNVFGIVSGQRRSLFLFLPPSLLDASWKLIMLPFT